MTLSVLVVDDDVVDRMSVKRSLSGKVRSGQGGVAGRTFRVHEAASATEAEHVLREHRVDLLLLDYHLPPDIGPEVLTRLRAIVPRLPCIFLSGQGSESIAVDAMKAGDDYLPKSALSEPRLLAQLVTRTFEAVQLEAEATRVQERLTVALEASGAAIWSVDGLQVSGDERFRRSFGLAEGTSWPFETWAEALTPEHAERLRRTVTDARGVQLQVQTRTGSWFELRGRGAAGHVTGTVTDISVAKRIEGEALALKDRLVGIASHDLKNPLSAVTLGARLLARTQGLDADQHRILEQILTSADRMSRLVSQLLDLTRVRLAGGLPINRVPLQLKPFLEGLINEVTLASGHSVTAEVDAALTVSADPDRLAQVVSNLLGNAVTHGIPGRPVRVVVAVTQRGCELSISNEGAELDAKTLESLFEPFVQGQGASTRKGLGLGLYISREVMRAHGGELEAASAAGVTTFRAILPS